MMMESVFSSRCCRIIRQLGNEIEAQRFKYLPHGILNFAVPGGFPEAYEFEAINIKILIREFNK